MKSLLDRNQLKRFKDLGWLLLKYGNRDLVHEAELEDLLGEQPDVVPDSADPADLARDLERLGPTYVKLGQLLSTQTSLLPARYVDALERLQDAVEPLPFEVVRGVLEAELEEPLERVFPELYEEPLAAASLGQVHQAVTRDGREVAIKVQRPGIKQQILEDFEALERVAGLLDARLHGRYDLPGVLAQARRTLLAELDYREEANNLRTVARNLARFPELVLPQPLERYCTSRVLTMDLIRGTKITEVGHLRLLQVDGQRLAERVFEAYLQQILVDGVFHADPHPGNVFLTEDDRVALIDLGMVGRVSPRLREQLLQLVLAVSEGRGDLAAELAIEIGERQPMFDPGPFNREISQLVLEQYESSLERMRFGTVVLRLARTCARAGLRMPDQVTVIGKALVNLDQIGRALAPDFEPNRVVREHVVGLLRRQLQETTTTSLALERSLELKHFAERLPSRLSSVLDLVADNSVGLKINAIDEDRLIVGIQKVANRITAGLVLAALIVGAAMLMRVETEFELLGYPGLAILLFLGAAVGGVILIVSSLVQDD